jgi:hypothetical protein
MDAKQCGCLLAVQEGLEFWKLSSWRHWFARGRLDCEPYEASSEWSLLQLFEQFAAHAEEPRFLNQVEFERRVDRFLEGQLSLAHASDVLAKGIRRPFGNANRSQEDAKLCFRATEDSLPRRFYATEKFTPEQVRQDASRAWKTSKIFYGGKRRKIRYKEVAGLYWQGGARQRPLRLIVIAPPPYRKSHSKKLYYRDPAYLLTTDLRSSLQQLLQIYFDRWQIEVNHREEKDTLGIGQAQLWNVVSVPKQPVLAVAAYSALLLASLQAFGAERGKVYAQLPSWRRNARRPSCLDLITLLRKEMQQQPALLAPLGFTITDQGLVHAAAA